jgi:hypothetical protein
MELAAGPTAASAAFGCSGADIAAKNVERLTPTAAATTIPEPTIASPLRYPVFGSPSDM